ncbi:hypothetical protein [Clostridium ihumii]|uniref:hypothetical protein n=1 Tax=Clostridium ihumii TaxID=1470356 RepID=UPI00058D511F|nr:hypothetical protein [Clostridium ihumii]
MKRLRITINFKANLKEEVELYNKLSSYSNTSSIIKDILLGRLPIEVLGLDTTEKTKFKSIDLSEIIDK